MAEAVVEEARVAALVVEALPTATPRRPQRPLHPAHRYPYAVADGYLYPVAFTDADAHVYTDVDTLAFVNPSRGIDLAAAQLQLTGMTRGSQPVGLLALGLLSFSGAGICAGSLWWLRRR